MLKKRLHAPIYQMMARRRKAFPSGLTEQMRVAVMDNLSDGVYFVDRSRRILYWNKGAERLSGFSAEEVIGRACREESLLNHTDEAGTALCGKLCPLLATMRDGKQREAHVFLHHKDGDRRPVCVRAAPLYDEEGKIVGAVETFHDDSALVDSRRWALSEQTLRSQSEVRFSALVQNSSDAIFVLNSDTRIQYASPSVAKVLGYRPHQLHGLALLRHVADADRDRARRALQEGEAIRSQTIELQIRHREGHWLHAECLVTNLLDDESVGGVVVNLRDITERKRLEEELTKQAFYDLLTDLPNRALFRNRLQHTLARRRCNEPTVVLFVDLDDFKSVNDTLGHTCGDQLLRETAKRLQACVRAGDTVARFGGDEFAVLLEETKHQTVTRIVKRLLAAVSAPLTLEGREMVVQCSIGVTVVEATDDTVDADILLRDADVAMYAAKRAGGNTYRRFAPEMQTAVADRVKLRDDLRSAVENGRLMLAFQPIFDFQTDEVEGYEALVRWTHPSRGAIPPSTFIPIAEDSGLIVALDNWVLRTACHAAATLQRRTPAARRLPVSVNMSAFQISRPDVVDEVRAALEATGLEPQDLVLEITESVLIASMSPAIERLSALRALGVRIALDDFGSGYSSLGYIGRLPIDQLKIDKRFIDTIDRDDRDSKLTATIIEMARVLELATVAEGIERPEQHERLKRLGCTYAQGFLLARPMSTHQLRQLLNARSASQRHAA